MSDQLLSPRGVHEQTAPAVHEVYVPSADVVREYGWVKEWLRTRTGYDMTLRVIRTSMQTHGWAYYLGFLLMLMAYLGFAFRYMGGSR